MIHIICGGLANVSEEHSALNFRREDGGNVFHRNVGTPHPDYKMVS
jgi:hypothetical protein